jgi:hypothetical protein
LRKNENRVRFSQLLYFQNNTDKVPLHLASGKMSSLAGGCGSEETTDQKLAASATETTLPPSPGGVRIALLDGVQNSCPVIRAAIIHHGGEGIDYFPQATEVVFPRMSDTVRIVDVRDFGNDVAST